MSDSKEIEMASKTPKTVEENDKKPKDSSENAEMAKPIGKGVSFNEPAEKSGTKAGDTSVSIPIERQKSFGETLTQRQVLTVVIALCLGLFMGALDNTIVTVSLPSITSDLNATNDQYYWPIIAYLLSSTAFAPSYGRLSDLYGRRTVYLVVLVIFLVGSAICGASVTIEMLIAARALQGIGGGGLMGLGFVVLGDVVPPRERGKYSGIMGGMFALSSVLGPLVGGVLTDQASWRWCFYINLPIGIVAAIMLFVAFKKNYKMTSGLRLDVAGTLLMVVAIVMIELGISWGGSKYAWDDPIIIILLSIGGFLVIPFIFVERDAPGPIIPIRLFNQKNVILPSICGFFLGIFMFGCFTYLPLWFQEVRGYSATDAGLQMIPLMFGLILTSILSGVLMSKTGRYKIYPVIGCILVPISCALFPLFDENSGQETFIPILLLAGLAVGLCIQVLTVIAQNDVSLKDIAVATTLLNFFRTIGGSIGVAIFGSIFNNEVTAIQADFTTSQEGVTMYLTQGQDAVVAYIISLAIRRTFIIFVPIVSLGFIAVLFTEEKPLRKTLDTVAIAE